jgi:hypothetical protein
MPTQQTQFGGKIEACLLLLSCICSIERFKMTWRGKCRGSPYITFVFSIAHVRDDILLSGFSSARDSDLFANSHDVVGKGACHESSNKAGLGAQQRGKQTKVVQPARWFSDSSQSYAETGLPSGIVLGLSRTSIPPLEAGVRMYISHCFFFFFAVLLQTRREEHPRF